MVSVIGRDLSGTAIIHKEHQHYDWLDFPFWYEAIAFFESENIGEFVSVWLKKRDADLAKRVLDNGSEFVAVLCKIRREVKSIEPKPQKLSPPSLRSRPTSVAARPPVPKRCWR
jgi:hypothetical protein